MEGVKLAHKLKYAIAVFAASIAGSVTLLVVTSSGSAASPPPCTPIPPASSSADWTPFGTGVWTPAGMVTTSQADPTQAYGVTCGGASLFGSALPTTNPQAITALSFDFNPDRSGPSGAAPRLVVCFSDGPVCDSNGSVAPSVWTANTWTHVDGFAPSATVTWSNTGGSCGTVTNTTWSAVVACHPGATITEVAVVNDSGAIYPAGETVLLNNFRVNNVTANAQQPILGQTAFVVPVSGNVMVKAAGARSFVSVKTVKTLNYGATVDASNGRLQIFAARPRKSNESGVFYSGAFHLTQSHSGLVKAALTGHPTACPAPRLKDAEPARARKRYRLWGHVSGNFQTSGSYGSASVLGTLWYTENRCDGTFFHVVQGVLRIRDFTRHRSVIIRTGHSYLAPAPPRKPVDEKP